MIPSAVGANSMRFDLASSRSVSPSQVNCTRTRCARPMARLIHAKIKEPLVDEILFGRLSAGGNVTVDGVQLSFVFCTELLVLASCATVPSPPPPALHLPPCTHSWKRPTFVTKLE